jgi:sensor c-di-GMP phosphodiesterase-like protein
VEAKGVEGTLMDTVIGNSYMYDSCVTVVSLEVTEAPGFEETLMDTVFGDLYTYKACPTVVSLEVTDTSTAETFQATAMIPSPREWGAEAAMVDIVNGHASMDEVLLAM